jgi:hypothetical protein
VSHPTLEDAKAAIEKTKAARPRCSECSVFDIRAFWHVTSGKHPPLDEDVIQDVVEASVLSQLGTLGWSLNHYGGSFIKPCEKCAATPEFPWAGRLDAEKVLAFMKAQPADSAFWLDALERTL